MLDEKFKLRMKKLLGDEYTAFIHALENKDAVRGLHVNTLKTDKRTFLKKTELSVSKLPYADTGFIFSDTDGAGNTAEHHSGMIYIQDPGAMATVEAVDIKPGFKVIDLCAAPGGKSSQIAMKIGEGGFLLANEFVPKRAKILVSNFERMGIKNAAVTSLDTAEFQKMYSDFFDLAVADVPCSGEGMFRKSLDSVFEWSEENVKGCAERQAGIIRNAAPLIKPGGYLLYSTCTYSLEENEMLIDSFLKDNPDFKLINVDKRVASATADGINFENSYCKELNLARRFYPHVSDGEGQFIALLQKKEGTGKERVLFKDSLKDLNKDEQKAVDDFFKNNLSEKTDGIIAKNGENIIILPHKCAIPPKSVFLAGVLLGSIQKGILFPHHQFFSAYGNLFKRKEHLSKGDVRVKKYLRGEEIDAKSFDSNGWCAVLYEGCALGGGKASGGKIKNHYPKGLRNK